MRLLAAKMSGGAKAYAAVVLIRIMYSGMHVMSKVALDQGMNPLVFLFYRHTTAALVLIPVTFVVERRKAKPVTFKIGWKMFIHALYGVTACGDLFNLGLNYTSATSSSALYNVQPVVTFILAVIFGMETLKLTRFHGKVKFAGILFCVAGVTILAFYEGPMFRSFNHHHLFQNGGGGGGSSAAGAGDTHSKKQWVLGIFLMTLSNVLAGLWTVLQAFLVAVAVERDFSKWRLGWNVGLAAIIYSVRRDRDGAFLLHANVDDRQEGPGVPGHVHAAHLRLHHRHILLRHRGRSQPRKHLCRGVTGWRPVQCVLGQEHRGARRRRPDEQDQRPGKSRAGQGGGQ
uniref:WAT1-related protein n=1 Tax=Zea mays TaxID=4577 RepID=A0A804QGQ2_MAIZE